MEMELNWEYIYIIFIIYIIHFWYYDLILSSSTAHSLCAAVAYDPRARGPRREATAAAGGDGP